MSSHGLFKLIADRIERKCMTHKQKFHRLDSKATLSERYRKTSQILGAGLSGAVFLGEDESGRKVAIKTLRSGLCVKDPAKMVKHLSREVELLLSVKHPHVVELLDAFEGPSSLTIVTELLEGGTLQSFLLDQEQVHEQEAVPIAKQMFLATGHLHSKSIVHRDLKPDNFMFAGPGQGEGVLKLIDFGFSKHFHEGKMMKSHKGTLSFMAPEVLQHQYTFKCDIWSLGVVVFRMLLGYLPFQDQMAVHPLLAQNFEATIQRHILAGHIILRNKADWDQLPPDAKDFVKSLLKVDQTKRPSTADALRHPWLNQPLQRRSGVKSLSISNLTLLPMLSAAAVRSSLSRAFLMLMIWIKVHPGDPDATPDAYSVCEATGTSDTSVHTCPCVNDGTLVKTIQDPSIAPQPASHIFQLLNNKSGFSSQDAKPLLEALLGLENSISMRDVSEAFSMIDTHRKGYLTEADLQLVFGPELHGKTMRAIIAEAKHSETGSGGSGGSGDSGPMDGMDGDAGDGTISAITYKELQQHLQRSAGQVPVASD